MNSLGLMNAWLLTALGKTLISVNALFHVFSSERDSAPQEVGLLFENSEIGRIYGGPDGASICFSFNSISSCDLGEYGRQDVFCVSGEPYFSDVVGRRLVSASLVQSLAEDAVVGVVLSFDNGFCLSILNLGDELFVYDDIPEEIVISEGVRLVSVS
ncbi:hypothetical protein ACQJ22_27330 [Pseudomonas fragariae (ex Marin et al. 2024)]|uniref:hypothetical protein n=1 Tax=Pseudomonas TaxID=286 RepID=UPI0009B08941|nr:hypothetical protein [Pseudomonas syringae]MCH5548606.1 hypothetical protein [Pseudomonas syringae pv. syringae]